MTNPHFVAADSWRDAAKLLTFTPMEPRETAGYSLEALRIHVRDHRQRELPMSERTLEAHYGGFVLSEVRSTKDDARQRALELRYGSEPREVQVAGHEGRSYEMGPEVPPDDVDGRMPAVVTWADGEMHFLLASAELSAETLQRIANSMYRRPRERR
jgi:hypothetical protein